VTLLVLPGSILIPYYFLLKIQAEQSVVADASSGNCDPMSDLEKSEKVRGHFFDICVLIYLSVMHYYFT
jgi:hypothetical protein